MATPGPHSFTALSDVDRARRDGTVLGIPLGDLGGFQTVLITLATTFAAFFLATFIGIVSLLVLMVATHRTPDFAVTYRWFGLPMGILTLLVVGSTLGTLYVRRKLRKQA